MTKIPRALLGPSPGDAWLPTKLWPTALSLLVLATAGCSLQIHEPTVDHDAEQDIPWQIHCETARTYDAVTQDAPGAEDSDWVFARDADDRPFAFTGTLVDGFFEVAGVSSPSSPPLVATRTLIRQMCVDTINRIEGDKELMLGWVMAARPGEDVNIPPVYANEIASGNQVTRLVIFGDSLTDTGRLKQRLRIFPANPYWIGRFSNGPVWPEYLAMSTGLGVQNHSYGGASAAEYDALPGANLYARTRDVGQFFVSGTIELQVDDYIERTLESGRIERADTTAFVLWAGANDYISKEPFTGLITTFLNSPEGESGYKAVVERVISELAKHVRTLYSAGGRRFIMIDLPDLGHTPIVLQNTTYIPAHPELNDIARRMELARRLTQLTVYHNTLLAETLEQLRVQLPESQIIPIDTFHYFRQINGVDSKGMHVGEHGFDLEALEETLEDQGRQLSLQQACYQGSYLGPLDNSKICAEPDKAIFWDTVHPTTLSHCWQAWRVGSEMSRAGWLNPLPKPDAYRAWCQYIVELVVLESPSNFKMPTLK